MVAGFIMGEAASKSRDLRGGSKSGFEECLDTKREWSAVTAHRR